MDYLAFFFALISIMIAGSSERLLFVLKCVLCCMTALGVVKMIMPGVHLVQLQDHGIFLSKMY
jgi:hypothetical protein